MEVFMEEMEQKPDQETQEYIFNQTMLRIKDPIKSLNSKDAD